MDGIGARVEASCMLLVHAAVHNHRWHAAVLDHRWREKFLMIMPQGECTRHDWLLYTSQETRLIRHTATSSSSYSNMFRRTSVAVTLYRNYSTSFRFIDWSRSRPSRKSQGGYVKNILPYLSMINCGRKEISVVDPSRTSKNVAVSGIGPC